MALELKLSCLWSIQLGNLGKQERFDSASLGIATVEVAGSPTAEQDEVTRLRIHDY